MFRCFIYVIFFFPFVSHAESYGLLDRFKIHQKLLQNYKPHKANELWTSLTNERSNLFRATFIYSLYSDMLIDESSVTENCQEHMCSLSFKAKVNSEHRDVIVNFIKKESQYYITSIRAN